RAIDLGDANSLEWGTESPIEQAARCNALAVVQGGLYVATTKSVFKIGIDGTALGDVTRIRGPARSIEVFPAPGTGPPDDYLVLVEDDAVRVILESDRRDLGSIAGHFLRAYPMQEGLLTQSVRESAGVREEVLKLHQLPLEGVFSLSELVVQRVATAAGEWPS